MPKTPVERFEMSWPGRKANVMTESKTFGTNAESKNFKEESGSGMREPFHNEVFKSVSQTPSAIGRS